MTIWAGGRVGRLAECVLAPNPGPVTLEGTNTWLLGLPSSGKVVVVDPGPDHEGHLQSVLATASRRHAQVACILLTHRHADHSAGARRLAGLAGAPVRALDPAHRLGSEGLADGDLIAVDGLQIDVVATPGHSGDSLCFVLPQAAAVLTGDTLLGRGTAVVAHPDGRLADYLASLQRLAALAQTGVEVMLPGHGPPLNEPLAVVQHYVHHRQERLAQVRAALTAGARSARAVVERAYADTDPSLWPAAELSVRAQLDYLSVPLR